MWRKANIDIFVYSVNHAIAEVANQLYGQAVEAIVSPF